MWLMLERVDQKIRDQVEKEMRLKLKKYDKGYFKS